MDTVGVGRDGGRCFNALFLFWRSSHHQLTVYKDRRFARYAAPSSVGRSVGRAKVQNRCHLWLLALVFQFERLQLLSAAAGTSCRPCFMMHLPMRGLRRRRRRRRRDSHSLDGWLPTLKVSCSEMTTLFR